MADRIAVMDAGRVRQVAPPSELYEYPNCRFVADFIGKINLFDGRVVGLEGSGVVVEIAALGRLSVPSAGPASGEVGVAVRPEKIRLDRERPGEGRIAVPGRVTELAYFGGSSYVYVAGEGGAVIHVNMQNAQRNLKSGVVVGDRVWCSWQPGDTLLLDA